MENSNVNRLSFGASLTAKLSSLIMVLLHFYCFIAFYNGVVVTSSGGLIGFADGFDAIDVVENSLKVAGDAIVGESGILTLFLPLLHIAFLIVALVNAISAFVKFFCLFGGGDEKLAKNQKNTFVIAKKLMGSGICMLVFMMLSTWVSGTGFTASAWLIIMAVSAGVIISRFANAVLINSPFTTKVMQIVYSAVMLGIIGFIMAFAKRSTSNVISDVGDSIDALSQSGISSGMIIANGLKAAAYVLLGVVMLNAVLMIRGCKTYALVPNKRIKRSCKNIFVCAIIAVAFITVSNAIIWSYDFGEFFKFVIKPMLPLLLTAFAAFFFGRIQPKVSKPPRDEAEDDEPEIEPVPAAPVDEQPSNEPESEPELNIVFVGKRVKKIKAKKYKNRKDINVIVIPKSVNYVEGYSFYGCTELQEIHCERESQARFWHKKWNYGCPAKVIWDSAESDED